MIYYTDFFFFFWGQGDILPKHCAGPLCIYGAYMFFVVFFKFQPGTLIIIQSYIKSLSGENIPLPVKLLW